MKVRVKKQLIAEYNAKYEAALQHRKAAARYVQLLKAPKTNG